MKVRIYPKQKSGKYKLFVNDELKAVGSYEFCKKEAQNIKELSTVN